MKIAVLGTRGFPGIQGGVEKHCEELYPRLAKKGCEVIVFTRRPYVTYPSQVYQGVKLVALSCPKNKFLEAFIHTFKGIFVARKIKPDIIHIHAIGPSLYVPFARLLGFKVVMTHHGPDYQRKKWGKFAKFVLRTGEHLGCGWANKIIAIAGHIAEHIQKEYGKPSAIIPNGVIIPEILKSDETLQKYGLVKGKYILTVGRFVPEKRFCDLVEAYEIASSPFDKLKASRNDGIRDWKLVIVGRADHEDNYSRELQKKAKEDSNIILTGFLSGKPLQELYSHAGLFALPSYYEGLPIVLLEAMSYGLSCIVSDIPAHKNIELSKDRFFQAGNSEELAEKIAHFMNKPLTEEEKAQQIKMIAEKYDWEKIADQTLEVYKKVVHVVEKKE